VEDSANARERVEINYALTLKHAVAVLHSNRTQRERMQSALRAGCTRLSETNLVFHRSDISVFHVIVAENERNTS
jgi:hypothetical protein